MSVHSHIYGESPGYNMDASRYPHCTFSTGLTFS